jgi:hypothetical protein
VYSVGHGKHKDHRQATSLHLREVRIRLGVRPEADPLRQVQITLLGSKERTMTTDELIASLRLLADWYQEHPSLPVPYELENSMFVFLYGKPPEEVKAALREIGNCQKVYDDPAEGDFSAIKTVGVFKLKFHTHREVVCTRKVIGKRQIDGYVIPAQPEKVVEPHEEDIVEWDCEPIRAER